MLDPFSHLQPIRGKLRDNALERVLAAVAFSPVFKIGDSSGAGIADFQEKVRKLYPQIVLEFEQAVNIQVSESGGELQTVVERSPVWRLYDSDSRNWRVSLTVKSLGLETRKGYVGRDDLVDRLSFLTDAIAETLAPTSITRVGYRYLNVFGSEKLSNLKKFVRPQLHAFEAEEFAGRLVSSTNQALFKCDHGLLMIKHGILDKGMMHEFMEEPVSHRNWYLDMDCWSDEPIPFAGAELRGISESLTAQICSFFDWSITKDFIDEFRIDT